MQPEHLLPQQADLLEQLIQREQDLLVIAADDWRRGRIRSAKLAAGLVSLLDSSAGAGLRRGGSLKIGLAPGTALDALGAAVDVGVALPRGGATDIGGARLLRSRSGAARVTSPVSSLRIALGLVCLCRGTRP